MYFQPRTLTEVVDVLSVRGGKILAGGTDFYPALGERVAAEDVVDVSRIAGLRGIEQTGEETRIGALTTWSDVLAHPLPRGFDALKQAAREVGSVQIQNRGTVAGNLCNASPAADGVPPLLALDAEVELVSSGGARRVKLEQFITGNRRTLRRPDEIMTAVCVPRAMEDAASVFLKLGSRRYLVISIVMVAVMIEKNEAAGTVKAARIAVGACSAVARRLRRLEDALAGKALDSGLEKLAVNDTLEALSPIDDVRGTAAYRRDAARTLIGRALDLCATGN